MATITEVDAEDVTVTLSKLEAREAAVAAYSTLSGLSLGDMVSRDHAALDRAFKKLADATTHASEGRPAD
jgi:hypothetical protein